MHDNPLKVIASQQTAAHANKDNSRAARLELQAKMERLWLTNPEQFDPTRNNIERERLERTVAAIAAIGPERGLAADLGCGSGAISRRLRITGWEVEAVDIASNALKIFQEKGCEGIKLIQGTLPNTKLPDNAYSLVVCTEVIGYLDPRDYRLLMSELSRLVNQSGYVACSTSIDIDSVDSLQRFGELVETEFEVVKWVFSYHLILIKIKRFFEIPGEYVKTANSKEQRQKEIAARSGLSRWWHRINTSLAGKFFWTPFSWIASPIITLLKQNRSLMLRLESLCKFFWDSAGISHALFIGRRRPLTLPTKADLESIERKGKRQVWE